MNVRRVSLAAVLAAIAVSPLLLSGSGGLGVRTVEASTVDQQQTGTSITVIFDLGSLSTGPVTAQTFTAGRSGKIDRVSLYLGASSGGESAPFDVQILGTTDAGAPDLSAVHASATIPAGTLSSGGAWVDVTFSQPAPIVSGTRYAIALSASESGDGTVDWSANLGGYNVGSRWDYDSPEWYPMEAYDFAFQTYVTSYTSYAFGGFLPPVESGPTPNVVRAGGAVPIKFSLGADEGLDIFAEGYPRSEATACGSDPADTSPLETVTAGQSSLSYDAETGQYTYVWKTDKSWASSCRQLVLKLNDGTSYTANFQFKP